MENKVDRPLGLVWGASYSHEHNHDLSKYEFRKACALLAFVVNTMCHAWAASAQPHTKRRKGLGVSESGTVFLAFFL